MSQRPRILVFDGPAGQAESLLERCSPDTEIVRAATVADGLVRLRTEQFDGVYVNPQDPALWERAGSLLQADYILDVLGEMKVQAAFFVIGSIILLFVDTRKAIREAAALEPVAA